MKLAARTKLVHESATLALNARVKQLAAAGKSIYNLTAGELGTDTPEFIQKAVGSTLHRNKYTPVAGLPELRGAIAVMARDFYGLDWIQPNNVVVTAGGKPALYATLLSLIDPGDEVIVPSPYWVSYKQLIELAGGVMTTVPLADTFDLDPAAIKSALTPKTKAIILNSPHNPTGAVFSEATLRSLAQILEATDVAVIADDLYVKLVYDDTFKPVPSCGFKHLVVVGGFSKSQALTGWRIGYMIAERPVVEAATKLLSHITANAALPSQHAALAAAVQGDIPPAKTIQDLQRGREKVADALDAIDSMRYCLPSGGFYFFIDIRKLSTDSIQWCEDLLERTGVALVPGEAFGAPGFARLSFGGDHKVLAQALKRIKGFVQKEHA